ncbi:hypothetical protein IP78_10675 [Brevundimonas sp. AAP58]|uniref:hypothetical protein n=1 Tax=Brevundimonas sp. AAP58 TaxID=1523422 RepID=UPI0006B8EEEF|nr:hypothetical protein [Brevundimonas sp. AAP58]KPF78792.1 hypothetical protein IP78_10675 [Brevundimonas sp. AAP58]
MKILPILTLAALVAGCASVSPERTAYAQGQTTFEGFVWFSGEEFLLMDSENRYRAGLQRPCVSGALPRDERRRSGDIGGQMVRITGTTLAWSDDLPGDRYVHEGSIVRNECGASFVILAQTIEAIR